MYCIDWRGLSSPVFLLSKKLPRGEFDMYMNVIEDPLQSMLYVYETLLSPLIRQRFHCARSFHSFHYPQHYLTSS